MKKKLKVEQDWRRHVEAQQDSGSSVAAYCREHKLAPWSFNYHKSRLEKSSFSRTKQMLRVKVDSQTKSVVRVILRDGTVIESSDLNIAARLASMLRG